jgi:hypothetical protein
MRKKVGKIPREQILSGNASVGLVSVGGMKAILAGDEQALTYITLIRRSGTAHEITAKFRGRQNAVRGSSTIF